MSNKSKKNRKPSKEQLPVVVTQDEWVDVPKGMTAALGVIPHPNQKRYPGVLVMEDNHESVVRWHNKGCKRTEKLDPAKVKFDRNGAPWCPTCFAENEANDPDWNAGKDRPTTLTPSPANGGATPRSQRNREALQTKRFRDIGDDHTTPAVGDGETIPVVGDLSLIIGGKRSEYVKEEKTDGGS
jgi:hypothetical protein